MSIDLKTFSQSLVMSRLLTEAEVRDAFIKAGIDGATTPEACADWLVRKNRLTKYQADSLLRGNKTFFLDDYKLLDRIGQGRMAGVYRAQHKLGMPVAIKILPPSRAKDGQCLARFQREASLALKMDHPRVVKTYHAGVSAGLNYIAMELLDGETLDERLDRVKSMPIPEALRVAQQILEGLQHMADRNVCHRDLKPSNLMLQTLPGQTDKNVYNVKLLDIGLGREMFDESDNAQPNAELTAAGTTLGTPNYMSPEQCRNAHTADIRSDLYSLGCLLYECITGRVPFTDKNIVQKLTKHATEMPPMPDYGNSPIAPRLHTFLWKLLAKKPAERYQSPAEALKEAVSLQQAVAPAQPLVAKLLEPTAPAAAPAKPTPPAASSPAKPSESIDVTLDDADDAPDRMDYLLWIAAGVLFFILLSIIGVFIMVKLR